MIDVKDKIESTPPKRITWDRFMLDTIEFDKNYGKTQGWHWFWGLYYLHTKLIGFPKFDIEQVQSKIPRGHWLNEINASNLPVISKYLSESIGNLVTYIENQPESNKIHLFGRDFKENVNFSNFIFPVEITQETAVFSGVANFSNTIFLENVNFTNTRFSKNANFKNAVFYGRSIRFRDVNFEKTADFKNVILEGSVSFKNVNFLGYANFKNTQLHNRADFEDARFFGKSNFKDTLFLKNSYFNGAIFYEIADFEKTKFCGEDAKFKGTTFKKIADFTNTTFKGYGNFKGSDFGGRTSFQHAIFEFHAPRFYGAKFNNEMTFFGMIPPKFEKFFYEENEEESEKDYENRIGENQNSYENTAILLEEKKKYHDQHFFFRQEMKCRRRIERKAAIRFSFWLYEKLANYGYGIERAAIAWALHIFIGFLVITFIAMCGGISYLESVSCAISVSFANANPYAFFGFDSVQLTGCYDMFNKHAPILFAIIKVIQTIVGVGLLFLVLLTLRIRFRLK